MNQLRGSVVLIRVPFHQTGESIVPFRSSYIPKIIRLACFIALCSMGWIRVEAKSMEVDGSKVALPDGNVLGAAFYESGGMFFVQQNVLSAPGNGLIIHSRRRMSSWSLASKSIVTKREFEESPLGASAPPCGRVEVSAKVRRVFICSSNSYIEVPRSIFFDRPR
jgi:hypothetical protein